MIDSRKPEAEGGDSMEREELTGALARAFRPPPPQSNGSWAQPGDVCGVIGADGSICAGTLEARLNAPMLCNAPGCGFEMPPR